VRSEARLRQQATSKFQCVCLHSTGPLSVFNVDPTRPITPNPNLKMSHPDPRGVVPGLSIAKCGSAHSPPSASRNPIHACYRLFLRISIIISVTPTPQGLASTTPPCAPIPRSWVCDYSPTLFDCFFDESLWTTMPDFWIVARWDGRTLPADYE
jgi:hypothetical protein